MRSTLIALTVAALAATTGFLAYHYGPFNPSDQTGSTPAPALSFHTVDGQVLDLASYRGRWVLINFWASWCAPCVDEIPLLVAAQKRHADSGLTIIGPALDEPDKVREAVTRLGINYPVTADFTGADAAMSLLGNQQGALPYSVLIDPQGRIAATELGAFDAESLNALLSEHLAAPTRQ